MNSKTKKYLWAFIGICVLLVVIIIRVSSSSGPAQPDKQAQFAQAAQKHFAEVLASIPELQDIHCVDNVCGNVVYFNFNTLPTDVDSVIRGNAATFSQLDFENTGSSHVTVAAQLNGKDLFQCSAADGKVTSCTNQ
jgi:hypothetical protein